MSAPVYIAGVGVITAIGNNVAENLAAFEREEAGMGDITLVNTIHRGVLPVAEVKLDNETLGNLAGISTKLSRTKMLSLIAAREAMNDAAIPNFKDLRTGFISANTVGVWIRARISLLSF
jgi:3-oxoacyl-(acyl-carrier-protein) synthase